MAEEPRHRDAFAADSDGFALLLVLRPVLHAVMLLALGALRHLMFVLGMISLRKGR
jgi:hypothetical protein